MLRRHQQVLILLIGLLYVYSVCPLLCSAFDQKFCYSEPQDVLNGATKVQSSCCQSPKTGAASEAEIPSESGKLCCSTDLELVIPDDRHNTSEFRELIGQPLVSILPISATSPFTPRESFQTLRVPLISTLFPDHSLSRRGPPPILS